MQFFLAERRIEQTLDALNDRQAQSLEHKREVAYRRAWGLMLRGRWDEAAQFILPEEISGETIADLQELGRTERRRRPYYLLVMGEVASRLRSYDQAIEHYTHGLRLLSERRMNDPTRRIRALLGLGRCHLKAGSPPTALEYYQQALRLCGHERRQPHLPHVYDGLSDTYSHLDNLDRALDYGNQALHLYMERGDKHSTCRIRSLLGEIHRQMGDLEAASASSTEALALAMGMKSIEAILTCLTALAEVRVQENKLEDAWRYCEMALEYRPQDPHPAGLGKLSLVCGKVREAQAKQAAGQEAQEAVEHALFFYEEAIETLTRTEARPELAEAYRLLAHVQEESGQPEQALASWKAACAAQAGLSDASLGANWERVW
jgi:tetratricopeptide (TPR) repeat protein